MNKYWWRSSNSKSIEIHWKCWDKLRKRKSEEGLGYKKLYNFNTALLGKQGWRLIQNPESLVARLYKARYYPGGNFLNAMFGNSPSYIWRSILEAQNLLKNGLSCRVGNGNDINILTDPWLPCESDPFIHTSSEAIKDQMVSSLLNNEQSQWDTDLLYDIFEE